MCWSTPGYCGGTDRGSRGAKSFLEKTIARVLYEESNYVSGQAYLYGAVAFAISFAIAVVVAMLLSKKMTSPIAEAQQRAKKDMDRFAAENSIVSSYQRARDFSSQADESEALPSIAPAPIEEEKQFEMRKSATLTDDEQRHVDEILSNNQLILLHAELYNKGIKETPSFGSLFLQSLISSANVNNHLVAITRAGSNLYHKVRGRRNTEIYLLSVSSMVPITKSAEGLVVISFTNISLIAESVRHTLEANPSSTIIFDNITEFVNTVGFTKVHPFIHTLSEIAHPYPNARIVILVNKNAHLPTEIQSIANMFNVFVQ